MSLKSARELWQAGQSEQALVAAWGAYDANPDGHGEKILVAQILRDEPERITAERAPALVTLLSDSRIDPGALSRAGWLHLERDSDVLASASPQETARKLENNGLALNLLR